MLHAALINQKTKIAPLTKFPISLLHPQLWYIWRQSFQKLVSGILRNSFKNHQDWGTFWTDSRIFCPISKKRNKVFLDNSNPHPTSFLFPDLEYFFIVLNLNSFFLNLTQCKEAFYLPYSIQIYISVSSLSSIDCITKSTLVWITRISGRPAAPYSSCSLRSHQCGGVCEVEVWRVRFEICLSHTHRHR